jgi:hypothetical protein
MYINDRLICPVACRGEPIEGRSKGKIPAWSQGVGSCPAREGEAASLEASFAGRKQAIQAGIENSCPSRLALMLECGGSGRGGLVLIRV